MKKHILLSIVLLVTALGCGKDEKNNAGGGGIGVGIGGGPPGNIQAAIQQIIGRTPCQEGRMLPQQFISNGGGPAQPGQQPSQGTWYAGRSAFGDLIFIQEINQGVPTTGYNIMLSFCNERNPYSGQWSIGPGIQLTNVQLSQVRLEQTYRCSVKKVGFAIVAMCTTGQYGTDCTIYTGEGATAFAPLNGCY